MSINSKTDNLILKQIKYDKHFELLTSIVDRLNCFCVYDMNFQQVWSRYHTDDDMNVVSEYIKIHRQAFASDDPIDFSSHQINSHEIIISLYLEDEINNDSIYLVFLIYINSGINKNIISHLQEQLSALGNCLVSERELNRELEDMADELGSRYDELNLIYQSDKNTTLNPYHTQGLLQRLVAECQEYLGVGMVALVMPDKNISIFEYSPARTVKGSPALFSLLKTDLLAKLAEEHSAIVINHQDDIVRYNLPLEEIFCKFILNPIESGDGVVIGLLAIINSPEHDDFTNSDKNLLDVISRKVTKVIVSNFDDLTGLMNHNAFETNLQELLNNSYSSGTEHAVLNIDIDRLNVINDISGRDAGNAVIEIIGKAITKLVRSRDSVARLAGDRFGVTLESCSLNTAEDMASRISKTVQELNFQWQEHKYDLSVCIGVAPISVENESFAITLSSVEAACNTAKEKGKSHIQVFHQDSIELLKMKGEMLWIERIQNAIREDKFVLFAQLIQGLGANSQERHYEILIRLIDDNDNIISPDQFLPSAEHYKLMPDIDHWVVKNVFNQVLTFVDQYGFFPFNLSINLSGQSLGNKNFEAFLYDQLKRLGKYTKQICFEITETTVITNIDEAQNLIANVKNMGCTFSLDDFGTGLSSYSYLKNLDVDYIKIDGSFVKEIDLDPVSESIVSSINHMGHVMKLQTIAEYVENETILSRLESMGVDFAQGYVLDRPQHFQVYLDKAAPDTLTRHNAKGSTDHV